MQEFGGNVMVLEVVSDYEGDLGLRLVTESVITADGDEFTGDFDHERDTIHAVDAGQMRDLI